MYTYTQNIVFSWYKLSPTIIIFDDILLNLLPKIISIYIFLICYLLILRNFHLNEIVTVTNDVLQKAWMLVCHIVSNVFSYKSNLSAKLESSVLALELIGFSIHCRKLNLVQNRNFKFLNYINTYKTLKILQRFQ